MIRIEITRRLDCKTGKGRNRVNPTTVTHEPTVEEALAHVRAMRIASEEIAPGYMPMLEVRLYDNDAFLRWVAKGGPEPRPFRTLTTDEIAAL